MLEDRSFFVISLYCHIFCIETIVPLQYFLAQLSRSWTYLKFFFSKVANRCCSMFFLQISIGQENELGKDFSRILLRTCNDLRIPYLIRIVSRSCPYQSYQKTVAKLFCFRCQAVPGDRTTIIISVFLFDNRDLTSLHFYMFCW